MATMVNREPTGADRRTVLANEWDALVEQAREVEGFVDFLRPPSPDTLADVSEAGPVVVINVSRRRCDALVLMPSGVHAVPLPRLTAVDVHNQTNRYLDILREPLTKPGRSFAETLNERAMARRAREAVLDSTMRWLWDTVAEPVLSALGMGDPHPVDAPPRLWWCPTGLLTLLPLHGAGYHDARDGRSVLDRVVSSYTPTLRALHETRRRSGPATAGQGLFVGMPDTVDQVSLGSEVVREHAVLERVLPGQVTTLQGHTATVESVKAALARHRWVHLSCHGSQDLRQPSRAGLVLSDGTLTLEQIATNEFVGELAFLSACRTATGGTELTEEAITLAAALNYTGFRHVVATLWTVHPAVAATVTEAVYPLLAAGNGLLTTDRTAAALHVAVRELRDGGARLSDWVPFVHYGP